ncbi:DDT domain-containing protein, putative isoform 1 [Hibiscus syriacus]|uniref:DDT domain-containing protein, putative isoform 1 n=1 Tax=Hibiscus syriacus TaxID=106335 RepID=A0A6A2ZIZ2_HIBSY|nr:DNA repair RAD52-like protein 2, chloroplastic [Hibiscus syriacus]KAE8691600.1 DDT domain-containing protein, putative isoform 1 [Hibiscus syriacus]
MASFQMRTCVVLHSQWSPQLSSDYNGQLAVGGGACRVRGRFIGHLRCSSSSSNAEKSVPNSNYVVPLDKTFSPSNSFITRPLVEILRDLNKRIPENRINAPSSSSASSTFLPWYHANRMLSFYAPGWCGEVRDVKFADDGTITVVYRLTIRGSDGEAHRESTGTVSSRDNNIADPVAAAEEMAFCRACARFGLGLYLYHEE